MMKIEKLQEWYAEELKRKDKLIDELRTQNTLLMKASINQSKKMEELTQQLKKLMKKKDI